jgi:intraflagellar transport protein 56
VLDDETKVAKYRQYLSDSRQDELSAAAIDLYRHQYKETADIYEMMRTHDDLALDVYLAICYFKMVREVTFWIIMFLLLHVLHFSRLQECFDLSLDALTHYSDVFPDSAIAANIKACNVYRLSEDGNAALEVFKTHCDEWSKKNNVYIQHNIVVFEGGQKALKVLSDLLDKVPEARLNLAVYYMQHKEIEAAAELMDNVKASCSQTKVLLGIINAEMGQTSRSQKLLESAQMYFENVGNSLTECDTILGRQCMVSSLFLEKEYEDALGYLGMLS